MSKMNKKGYLDFNKIGVALLAGVIGLLIGYMIWGQTYTQLNSAYQELNENYNLLQKNYTQLKEDCEQILIRYNSCVDRETFFEWVNRLSSIASLAKFIGLI